MLAFVIFQDNWTMETKVKIRKEVSLQSKILGGGGLMVEKLVISKYR